jgi:hypothetical protein
MLCSHTYASTPSPFLPHAMLHVSVVFRAIFGRITGGEGVCVWLLGVHETLCQVPPCLGAFQRVVD